MVGGFILAAYAVVGNDAIQTLGTFLASNSKRPWWVLWLFAGTILTVTLFYGWATHPISYVEVDPGQPPVLQKIDDGKPLMEHTGDASYYRLGKKYPDVQVFSWYHLLPPLVLLMLTRFGFPVSTSFLILTSFSVTNMPDMLQKSLLGYAVAFAAGLAVWLLITKLVEERFRKNDTDNPGLHWVIFQWASTGFLWSMWLIQDMANIFVYMPRALPLGWLVVSVLILLAMLAVIFRAKGGRIQRIVLQKTATTDIRSATFVDLTYGIILFYFKNMNDVPMSTTWVFLGLLAGREIGMSIMSGRRSLREVAVLVGKDAGKALVGLILSILLAMFLSNFVA